MKTQPFKVLLLDINGSRASILNKALKDYGYPVLAVIDTAEHLSEAVAHYQPDLIVVGIDLPDKKTLIHIAELSKSTPLPVIMFAEKDTPEIINQVVKAGINAFVVDDIQAQRINSIISIAVARFIDNQQLQSELLQTRNKLEERKLLEIAKGLLMKQQNIDEDQAFKLIRKAAMDKGMTLTQTAQNTIDVMKMLGADTSI